jgi:hypothetical protein
LNRIFKKSIGNASSGPLSNLNPDLKEAFNTELEQGSIKNREELANTTDITYCGSCVEPIGLYFNNNNRKEIDKYYCILNEKLVLEKDKTTA